MRFEKRQFFREYGWVLKLNKYNYEKNSYRSCPLAVLMKKRLKVLQTTGFISKISH